MERDDPALPATLVVSPVRPGFPVSPDDKWIASGDGTGAIRLWPMQAVSKTPLQALPHADLLSRLRSLTNLRVVPDEPFPGGYKPEAGPFPGWVDVPEW